MSAILDAIGGAAGIIWNLRKSVENLRGHSL